MTPEEMEIRENFGIKDEDILQIPPLALWELCRQFNVLVGNNGSPQGLGDFFYRFYYIRTEELVRQKAKVRATLNAKMETERREFDREAALLSFKPFLK